VEPALPGDWPFCPLWSHVTIPHSTAGECTADRVSLFRWPECDWVGFPWSPVIHCWTVGATPHWPGCWDAAGHLFVGWPTSRKWWNRWCSHSSLCSIVDMVLRTCVTQLGFQIMPPTSETSLTH